MTKTEAIDHFGGAKHGGVRALADALTKAGWPIKVQSIYEWPENAIPTGRQFQIQLITKNKLKADQPESKPAA